jgi:dTDP-4-dehydrorhamnose 3,5-epimerase
MKFIETKLKGAYLIEPDLIRDDRGFFARSWCQKEFTDNGLNPNLVQCNISFNHHQGTLRGMHYQIAPYEEAKVVRCTAGAIYDVIVDLRPDSETFKQWVALKLTAVNHQALYIPAGMAHGFQTLADNSEVLYQMSEFYHPESARGLRWDDRVLGIAWPTELPSVISERDLSYADFDL